MIRANDITVRLDNKIILEDISFHICQNEKTIIYGSSGSGKTTLLSCILGFTPLFKGSITVNNSSVSPSTINEIRKLIAWVPQEFSLPFETVNEWFDCILHFKSNKNIRIDRNEIFRQFEQLGLEREILNKRVAEISGGQKQRAMIIAALIQNKTILMMDEPTSALDRESIKQLIGVLQSQTEKTIVCVSHDEEFIHAFDKTIHIERNDR